MQEAAPSGRGRVGRGQLDSFCLLLYGEPLSKEGKQRLEVMRKSQDGFYIAEQDLAIRGPGEVLGTRQTGVMQFKIADLMRDKGLLPTVERLATAMNQQTPMYIEPLISRWLQQSIRFAQV